MKALRDHKMTMTQSVKGRGSKAGNLVYRAMMDEEGRVIGVLIDSNDDSGFWLEVPFPNNVNEPDESKKANDDDEKEEEKEEEEHNKKRNRDIDPDDNDETFD